MGFATFGTLATLAFVLVAALHQQWLAWALPREEATLEFETSVVHAE
jgi:NNP family nitrate/nitrite transporter-like MFS transporter